MVGREHPASLRTHLLVKTGDKTGERTILAVLTNSETGMVGFSGSPPRAFRTPLLVNNVQKGSITGIPPTVKRVKAGLGTGLSGGVAYKRVRGRYIPGCL